MTLSPLRIRFVLPSGFPVGGAQVVMRHGRYLADRGHDVLIIWPRSRPGSPWTAEGRLALRLWTVQRLARSPAETVSRLGVGGLIREVDRVDGRSMPAGDVVVATAFRTAEWVAELSNRAGAKVYFLQSYEAYTQDLEARVDATWRLPFVRLAVSRWLMDWGRERLGVMCRGPITNGVDPRHFHPSGRRSGETDVTIGGIYDPLPPKGLDDLLDVLNAVAETRPRARFLLFGRSRLRHRLPPRTRYVSWPDWDRVPELYREMDVFLYASRREGWGLPPMEAMASGCAVIATATGGVPEFADPSSARIVPSGDLDAMQQAAEELVDDAPLRVRLGGAARERILAFTWEAAFRRMESELAEVVKRKA